MKDQWIHKIFNATANNFKDLALEIFRFQYEHNLFYHDYVNALQINANSVDSIIRIPFLPVSFFKSHAIQTAEFTAELLFESSGTTGSRNSLHYIKDKAIYEKSFNLGFETFYGPVEDWCIIGLLPSYLERDNSSLIYMVNSLIAKSGHASSGFYLDATDKLIATLLALEKAGQKTLLIGVTFALLDFAEQYKGPALEHVIIMETGGMKGRRQEITRMEVHDILKKAFRVATVHSEYGMTELLSQAYSKGDGIFHEPPWMKILLRDEEDPLHIMNGVADRALKRGVINVIDLANVHSCSFIATDDAGEISHDGSFRVLGRVDNSDLRGCSLLTV